MSELHESPAQLELVIDIGDTSKATLQIYADSSPNYLACCFCYQHNLDFKLIPIIADEITHLMHDTFKSQQQHDEDEQLQEEQEQEGVFRTIQGSEMVASVELSGSQARSSRMSSTTSTSINRGYLMYERNLRLDEEKRRHLQRLEQQRELESQKDLTFQPKINTLSKILALRLEEDDTSIYQRNEQRRINRSLLYRAQKEKTVMEECTFKPKTNCKTYQHDPERYLSLYNENLIRRSKLQKASRHHDENLSFHPEVNRISNLLVGNVSFEERLSRQKQHSQKKSTIKSSADSYLHKPLTGRPPHLRNLQNLPIGDYLYNKRKRESIQTPKEKMSFVNSRSEMLYNEKKKAVFTVVFQHLDTDGDGVIDSSTVDTNQLCEEVWVMIYPLIEEMKEMGVTLNYEEFLNSLEELFKTFNTLDKNKFFQLFKTSDDNGECSLRRDASRVRNKSVTKSSHTSSVVGNPNPKTVNKLKVRAFR